MFISHYQPHSLAAATWPQLRVQEHSCDRRPAAAAAAAAAQPWRKKGLTHVCLGSVHIINPGAEPFLYRMLWSSSQSTSVWFWRTKSWPFWIPRHYSCPGGGGSLSVVLLVLLFLLVSNSPFGLFSLRIVSGAFFFCSSRQAVMRQTHPFFAWRTSSWRRSQTRWRCGQRGSWRSRRQRTRPMCGATRNRLRGCDSQSGSVWQGNLAEIQTRPRIAAAIFFGTL